MALHAGRKWKRELNLHQAGEPPDADARLRRLNLTELTIRMVQLRGAHDQATGLSRAGQGQPMLKDIDGDEAALTR